MCLEECAELFGSPPSEIGIILVSNRKIKKLNSQFLNKNSVTDTMSFKISRNYGEIVISAETAEENGKTYGLTTEEEILYLIVHGYLHLKNYKDYTENERKIMFKKQNSLFKKILKASRGKCGKYGKKQ